MGVILGFATAFPQALSKHVPIPIAAPKETHNVSVLERLSLVPWLCFGAKLGVLASDARQPVYKDVDLHR